jgi:hypothetical protein
LLATAGGSCEHGTGVHTMTAAAAMGLLHSFQSEIKKYILVMIKQGSAFIFSFFFRNVLMTTTNNYYQASFLKWMPLIIYSK